jgi:hypothetical protein
MVVALASMQVDRVGPSDSSPRAAAGDNAIVRVVLARRSPSSVST